MARKVQLQQHIVTLNLYGKSDFQVEPSLVFYVLRYNKTIRSEKRKESNEEKAERISQVLTLPPPRRSCRDRAEKLEKRPEKSELLKNLKGKWLAVSGVGLPQTSHSDNLKIRARIVSDGLRGSRKMACGRGLSGCDKNN
jgi:hypothetical protein